MNYFPFHLGDYAAHTGHLEPMEDLAYRRLLDQYYMREGPLPVDIQVTAKLIRMRSMAGDVESVLNEFFSLTAAGWVHERCEMEIEEMQERQEIAKTKANKRWDMHRAELSKAAAMPQHTKKHATALNSDAGAMLPTPTPTPIPNKNTSAVAPPDGVSISIWRDFVEHRKAKKAKLTQTAIDGIQREAAKAGWTLDAALTECCSRGWTGFKADWVAQKQAYPSVVALTVPSKPGVDPALAKVIAESLTCKGPPPDIRARMQELSRAVA